MGIRAGLFAVVLTGPLAFGLAGAAGASMTGDPLLRTAEDPARQGVIDDFYDVWLHNQKVNLGWTGHVDGCEPGRVSSTGREATLSQINYFRELAGLRPISFDADLTRAAQRTALMMQANDQLSHDPPRWWKCHTRIGDALAGRSNLALGSGGAGPRAVSLYVRDSSLPSVAHRRWLLNPRTAQMAAGSTAAANALVVVGMPQHRLDVPAWIPWPGPGYFPVPLEPDGRWSLSAGSTRTDFSRARIQVIDDAGNEYAVKKFPLTAAYGPPTLVWQVARLRAPTLDRDRTYTVRVTGVERANERVRPVSWTVILVEPDRPTAVVEPPVIRGKFAVGSELMVSPGTWSPKPANLTYRWTRDGEPIPGATYPFYNLTAADAGHVVSAVVSASATYYARGRAEARGQRVIG